MVRVRQAARGPSRLPRSLSEAEGIEELDNLDPDTRLRCSLVVPSRTNAFVLECSILDYFAYTDRAIAFQVPRAREFAPVREGKGRHTPDSARRALHALHCSWVLSVGACVEFEDSVDPDACLEVSPLLSYEGEGLCLNGESLEGAILQLPCHLTGPEEAETNGTGAAEGTSDGKDEGVAASPSPGAGGGIGVGEEGVDGLDTRLFYLQEYALRPEMSQSHVPQFFGASGRSGGPGGANRPAIMR